MKRIIGIFLIVLAVGLGYMGLNKMQESTTTLSIGPIEMSASDKDSKTESYVYLGLGVALLLVGFTMVKTK